MYSFPFAESDLMDIVRHFEENKRRDDADEDDNRENADIVPHTWGMYDYVFRFQASICRIRSENYKEEKGNNIWTGYAQT